MKKYDLLTALGVYALAGDWRRQRLILRLMALITARYNWRLDELSIARTEIAQLWGVDERTVKRELGKLKEAGFLRVKRAGARGRATTYALDLEILWAATAEFWPRVGSDFVNRRCGGEDAAAPHGASGGCVVVPFPATLAGPDQNCEDKESSLWSQMRILLKTWSAARYERWLQPLAADQQSTELRLRAPSAFHANYVEQKLIGDLEAAAGICGASGLRIRVTAETISG